MDGSSLVVCWWHECQEYMTITGASKTTATRDLQDLAEKDILPPLAKDEALVIGPTYSPTTNGQ